MFQEPESNSEGTSRKCAVKGVIGLSKGGLEWKLPSFFQCVEGKTVSMNVHCFLVCGIEDGRESLQTASMNRLPLQDRECIG